MAKISRACRLMNLTRSPSGGESGHIVCITEDSVMSNNVLLDAKYPFLGFGNRDSLRASLTYSTKSRTWSVMVDVFRCECQMSVQTALGTLE